MVQCGESQILGHEIRRALCRVKRRLTVILQAIFNNFQHYTIDISLLHSNSHERFSFVYFSYEMAIKLLQCKKQHLARAIARDIFIHYHRKICIHLITYHLMGCSKRFFIEVVKKNAFRVALDSLLI